MEPGLDCLTCKSISGARRISPGPTIYETAHWLVEHAYPCGMRGWLVLVLRRHAEALHELTDEEFRELGELQGMTARVLRGVLACEKEYFMCLAEGEGFKHIHAHVVAKPHDLPDELRGARIFAMLRPEVDAVPPEDIAEFCEVLREEFTRV